MAADSRIEWTQKTWNPVIGCTKVSPGCKYCYAESMAHRLSAMGVRGYENGFDVTVLPDRLGQPLERRKPTVYFVNSMSDLFHEHVGKGFIDEVMNTIEETPQHRYQILTKRHLRMAAYFKTRRAPRNVWLGVSVEDREYGVPRIDSLRRIVVPTRFLSVEPLLEDLGKIDLQGIHWVIVGGESGPSARPMSKEWVISIRDQCTAEGVPFFFKQWGRWGADGKSRSKKANGRRLEGRTWDQMPHHFRENQA